MKYYIRIVSNPAPFVGDSEEKYIEAESVEDAVKKAEKEYTHPSGIYSLGIWNSHQDWLEGKKGLRETLTL